MNLNPVTLIKKSYQSEKKNIELIADEICRLIYDSKCENEFPVQEIFLAIDEAVSNAMEHGNNWDKQKLVYIDVSRINDEITITITDSGKGFDTNSVNYELDKNNLLKTRGRGIFIMNKFCDLKWNSAGNELKMKIKKEFTPK